MSLAAVAVGAVRVVAHIDETRAAVACVDEAVGAASQNCLVVGARAPVELIEMVAVFLMRQGALPGFAVHCLVVVVEDGDRWLGQWWHATSTYVRWFLLSVVFIVIVNVGPILSAILLCVW